MKRKQHIGIESGGDLNCTVIYKLSNELKLKAVFFCLCSNRCPSAIKRNKENSFKTNQRLHITDKIKFRKISENINKTVEQEKVA
jgi:hypothetical protein